MRINQYLILIILLLFAACNSTQSNNLSGDASDNNMDISLETGQVDAVLRSAPFSKGVNFSGWFESFSAQSIPFTKYTEQDFANVKSLGADVIRLPVKVHSMTSGAPNYTIDPLLFKFLDTAVDWAEKYRIYLIIDNHSFDPVAPTSNDIDKILLPVWAQIARRYKDRSNYVVYEILNEPHGISDKRWGEIQGLAIETIRRIDQKHAIIPGGTDYNSIGKLASIPVYSDDNLIYTFHFYDPHVFTHQGATWGEPSMASLEGIPFPYDIRRMPKTPNNLRGTWLENAIRNYEWDAKFNILRITLDKVVTFSKTRNVPVFCGEFGVYMINSRNADRVRWYKFVTDALDKRNISRTSWDYFGGFGVFAHEGRGDFYSELNVDVVKAMGFTPPPQKQRSREPFKSGFVIYDDYPNVEFPVGYWGEKTDFSMYDANSAEGEFAIRWGKTVQYNIFWFDFSNNGNFNNLLSSGYALEFKARTEKPVNFDIRFVNPENASSIPWRMRYVINEKILPSDGKWHSIRIPLKDMSEHGAWINAKQQWLNPNGQFSWENIKQLEFVAEYSAIDNVIWFDSIRITQ
jgi:endoglucanase